MSKQGSSRRRKPKLPIEGRDLTRLEDIPTSAPQSPLIFDSWGSRCRASCWGCDPYAMYGDLCHITGQRHDPCLLDTFIAAVRFMEGETKKPWWKYTAERKTVLAVRRLG